MAENKQPTAIIEVVDCPIQYAGKILEIGTKHEIEINKANELVKIGVAKIIKGK